MLSARTMLRGQCCEDNNVARTMLRGQLNVARTINVVQRHSLILIGWFTSWLVRQSATPVMQLLVGTREDNFMYGHVARTI